jgi:hypothetical protein
VFIGWGMQSLRDCARGRCQGEGWGEKGLCAVFDRKIQSKRYSPICLFFPQFIAISRDFTTSITTLCLLWILFDFGSWRAISLPHQTFSRHASRRFAACGALFTALAGGIAWNLAVNRLFCDEMRFPLPE